MNDLNNTTIENRQFNSLQELCDFFCHQPATPANLGRTFYKNTDCGPWTAFLVETQKSFVISEQFIVSKTNDGLTVKPKYAHGNCSAELKGKMCSFLGFDNNYISKEEHSIDSYLGLLQGFTGENSEYTFTFTPTDTDINIEVSRAVPANIEEIYFEDTKANTLDWIANCIGIKIGSIVEGSEVEIEPQTLLFPIFTQELEVVISAINDEASFYWERDNSTWYFVRNNDEYFTLRETSGEFFWEDTPTLPKETRTMVETWLNKRFDSDIFSLDECGHAITADLGIEEHFNDNIY